MHSLIKPEDCVVSGRDSTWGRLKLCDLCKGELRENASNLRWSLTGAITEAETLISRYNFEINTIYSTGNTDDFETLETLDRLAFDGFTQAKILNSLRVLREIIRHVEYQD